MALNNTGLGFSVTATDSASATLKTISKSVDEMGRAAEGASKSVGKLRNEQGKFVKSGNNVPKTLPSATAGKAGGTGAASQVEQFKIPEALIAKVQKENQKKLETAQKSANKFIADLQKQAQKDMEAKAKQAATAADTFIDQQVKGITVARKKVAEAQKAASKASAEKDSNSLFSKEHLTDVGGELRNLGGRFVAFGGTIAAGLGEAAQSSADFQTSVAKVASIADKSEFPLEKIRSIILGLNQQFGGGLEAQADALFDAISSGATKAADATDLLNIANKLAIGGQTDARTAIAALTGVQAAGIKGFQSFTQAADLMFQTVNIGKGEMKDLAGSIGQVIPIAAGFGVGIQELFAAIAAGSQTLGTMPQAIDGLKEVLTNIAKPTSDAAKEAKKLGIEFNLQALQSKGLANLLFEVTSKSKDSTASFNELFGSATALKTVLALTGDDSKLLKEALAGMEKSAGSTDLAFHTMAETANFANGILQGNLKEALTHIGDVIAPLIGLVLQFVNKVVQGFNKLPKTVQSVLVGFVAFAGAAATVLGGVIALAGGIAALVAIKTALLASLAVAAGLFVILGAAIAPVALILVGFYQAWQHNVAGIANRIAVWIDKIKLAFEALQQLFTDGGFSGAVLEAFDQGNEGVESFAIEIFIWYNRIKNFFAGISDGFDRALAAAGPAIDILLSGLEKIGTMLGLVQDSASDAQSRFDSFGAAGERVGGFLGKAFEFLVETMSDVVHVVDGFLEGLQVMGGTFKQVWIAVQQLGTAFGRLIDAFKSQDEATATSNSAFEQFGLGLGEFIGTLVAGLTTIAQYVSLMVNQVSSAIEMIKAKFADFSVIFNDYVGFFKAVIDGDWSAAWDKARQIVFDVASRIIDMVAKMVAGIAKAVDKVFGTNFSKKVADAKTALSENLRTSLSADVRTEHTPQKAKPVPKPVRTLDTTGQSSPTPPGTPSEKTAPAVAQAAGTTRALGALNKPAQAPPPPVNVTSHTHLHLDGNQIAESVTKHQQHGNARAYGPTQPHP